MKKTKLTVLDRMRLDSARGLEINGESDRSGRMPTVERYNTAVKSGTLCGVPITPIGSETFGES